MIAVLMSVVLPFSATSAPAASRPARQAGKKKTVGLTSLKSDAILTVLDLSGAGLENAARRAAANDRLGALSALRDHYRMVYKLKKGSAGGSFPEADKIVRHVFQWGPYPEADYGREMNWEWDPRGDIEWVASMYRFNWVVPLIEAYTVTRDEKYARAFTELTSDWIARHPLENHERAHPVYKHWRGFAWLDIQTGVRANQLCKGLRTFVHADAFTPEFLGILLASLYDHQVKTERLPMGAVHNKAIFEQRGFVETAITVPEFKDSRRWLQIASRIVTDSLLAQTTPDGVQREWSGGYHMAVLRDAERIASRVGTAGITMPKAFADRIRAMHDYVFWIATPDLGFPMFGDCSRPIDPPQSRSAWPLYSPLKGATASTGDPRYAALADLKADALPRECSHAFLQAGFYALRSDWTPQQTYLALHCSPPAISGHDHPDNGTFELCAYGRWLMTDSGFYTYGHDAAARAWHRQTRVHQTLTLDGRNAEIDGRNLLWHSGPDCEAMVVENRSHPALRHRRSLWFVNREFFVLFDEAIGSAPGTLDLHFQLAAGEARLDLSGRRATTQFPGANVLVCLASDTPAEMIEEESWFAWEYGRRKPRKSFAFRHTRPAPSAFLTLLVPYRGTEAPSVSARMPGDFAVDGDRIVLKISVAGKTWTVGRDLKAPRAWCE